MLDLIYKNLKLIPSKSAVMEMIKLGFDITDCKKILEFGYDAPRKRAKDTIEKGTIEKIKHIM